MKEYYCKNLFDESPVISDADMRQMIASDCVIAPAGYVSSLSDFFPAIGRELLAAAALGKKILYASAFNCTSQERELLQHTLSSVHGAPQ